MESIRSAARSSAASRSASRRQPQMKLVRRTAAVFSSRTVAAQQVEDLASHGAVRDICRRLLGCPACRSRQQWCATFTRLAVRISPTTVSTPPAEFKKLFVISASIQDPSMARALRTCIESRFACSSHEKGLFLPTRIPGLLLSWSNSDFTPILEFCEAHNPQVAEDLERW